MHLGFCWPTPTNIHIPIERLKAHRALGFDRCRFGPDMSRIAKREPPHPVAIGEVDHTPITYGWDDPNTIYLIGPDRKPGPSVRENYENLLAAGFRVYVNPGGVPAWASGGLPAFSSGDGADLHVGCTVWDFVIDASAENVVFCPDATRPVGATAFGSIAAVGPGPNGMQMKVWATLLRGTSIDESPWMITVNAPLSSSVKPGGGVLSVGDYVAVRGELHTQGSGIRYAEERDYCTTAVPDLMDGIVGEFGREVALEFPEAEAYGWGNELDERLSDAWMHPDQHGDYGQIEKRVLPQMLVPFANAVRSVRPDAIIAGAETAYDGGTQRVHTEANRLWINRSIPRPMFNRRFVHPYGAGLGAFPDCSYAHIEAHRKALQLADDAYKTTSDAAFGIGEIGCDPSQTADYILGVHKRFGDIPLYGLRGFMPDDLLNPDNTPNTHGLEVQAAIRSINAKRRAASHA